MSVRLSVTTAVLNGAVWHADGALAVSPVPSREWERGFKSVGTFLQVPHTGTAKKEARTEPCRTNSCRITPRPDRGMICKVGRCGVRRTGTPTIRIPPVASGHIDPPSCWGTPAGAGYAEQAIRTLGCEPDGPERPRA